MQVDAEEAQAGTTTPADAVRTSIVKHWPDKAQYPRPYPSLRLSRSIFVSTASLILL
jgi:hypothetical protein